MALRLKRRTTREVSLVSTISTEILLLMRTWIFFLFLGEMEIDSGAPDAAVKASEETAQPKVSTSGDRDSNSARRKKGKQSKAVFHIKGGRRGKPRR
jgi:hypothetical protein